MKDFSLNYEEEMRKALRSVPNDLDKRVGSLIYTAIAPSILQMTEMSHKMNSLYRLLFAVTSSGDSLDKRLAEFGFNRLEATYAIRRLVITDRNGNPFDDVPIGTVFYRELREYEVIGFLGNGNYEAKCLFAGSEGNQHFEEVVPAEAINLIGKAEVTEVLKPARDRETDGEYLTRFIDRRGRISFGGNRSSYAEYLTGIDGVGAARAERTPEGPSTVGITILGADMLPANQNLIETVQTVLDPPGRSGEGDGLAPIWHIVDVKTTTTLPLVVYAEMETSLSVEKATFAVEQTLELYLQELRTQWQTDDKIIVRYSQIMSKILNIDGVYDVTVLTVNNEMSNIEITGDPLPIPVVGGVTVEKKP